MPISLPRVCPVLVERDAEVAALDAQFVEAAAGQGRFVVLTGEAGAGKSRLAREAERLAVERGFQRLVGGCRERDRDYPFAPIVDALRQRLVASPDEAEHLLGPHRTSLADLLPELRDVEQPGDDLPPEHGKRRLFEAVAALLAYHAARQPLLLVLEDLHWADATSLELLELLPRRLGHARLLILGTARAGEPNQDLRRSLDALRRARDVVEIPVKSLAEAGVRRMLEALLDPVPSPALVTAVFALTAGNPFYVEELLAATPDAARKPWLLRETAVPESVQETILRRTAGLPLIARRVLELAAVIGQRVEFDLLQAASGLEASDLLAALRVLVDERFLAEERSPGRARLVIRHALTREALLGRLLLPERQALHLLVGEALERDGADGERPAELLGELGYHFHAAGAWEQALAYAAQAGEAARRVQATVEALNHDRRALDAALALDDPRAADLHRRCGQGIALLGDFDAAREHLIAARALATRFALGSVEQAVLYDLSGLYASRDYAAARTFAEEALSLARADGDRHREALVLNRLGNVLTNLRRFDEGRAMHEHALRIFHELEAPWGIADCWDLIGMARYLAGEAPEARQAFGMAAALFEDLGDVERRASALTSRGLYLAALDGACATDAPPAAYRADADVGLGLSRQIAWRAGEAYALVAMASVDIGEGRFDEAQRHGGAALAIAEEIGHDQWQVIALLTLGILDASLLDPVRALDRFERARGIAANAGAEQWVERLDSWIACCLVRTGTLEAAIPHPLEAPTSIGQRRALVALAERELAGGRPERALEAIDRLLLGAAGPRPAEAIVLRGMALAALGRVEEADAALLDARRLAAEFGPRVVSWSVAAQRAALWRGRDAKVTDAELVIGRAEIMDLAGTVGDDVRRAPFLQAPAVRALVAPAGRRRTSDAAGPGGLTPREREVAIRIAQGLSNKEIARDLGVAEKTVEMHVGSSLGKLGFASRSQIAAWVVAEGLVVPPEPLG
jgi:DNA-binding CsgD family transcriptional regulator/tetratricopeptide (TPR) repeat protein